MAPQKLQAGSILPTISLPKVGGGNLQIGGAGDWKMLVVYRGKHCPICRTYLKTLDGLFDQFKHAGTEVVAVSADPKEKAESEAGDEGWRFAVGYDLSQDQMRALGLYISEPRSPQETDRPFSEPALFITNPEGNSRLWMFPMRRLHDPSSIRCCPASSSFRKSIIRYGERSHD